MTIGCSRKRYTAAAKVFLEVAKGLVYRFFEVAFFPLRIAKLQ